MKGNKPDSNKYGLFSVVCGCMWVCVGGCLSVWQSVTHMGPKVERGLLDKKGAVGRSIRRVMVDSILHTCMKMS